MHTLGHTRTGRCICTMEEDEDGDEALDENPECPVAGDSRRWRWVAFSPDGKQFVGESGDYVDGPDDDGDRLVKIWNTETGAEVMSSFVGLFGVW